MKSNIKKQMDGLIEYDPRYFKSKGYDKVFNLYIKCSKSGFFGTKEVVLINGDLFIEDKFVSIVYPWCKIFTKQLSKDELDAGQKLINELRQKQKAKRALSIVAKFVAAFALPGVLSKLSKAIPAALPGEWKWCLIEAYNALADKVEPI